MILTPCCRSSSGLDLGTSFSALHFASLFFLLVYVMYSSSSSSLLLFSDEDRDGGIFSFLYRGPTAADQAAAAAVQTVAAVEGNPSPFASPAAVAARAVPSAFVAVASFVAAVVVAAAAAVIIAAVAFVTAAVLQLLCLRPSSGEGDLPLQHAHLLSPFARTNGGLLRYLLSGLFKC